MFKKLSAPDLIDTYRREPAGSLEPVVRTLQHLAQGEGVDHLSVVTHLGSVVITTAPDHAEETRHPGVAIVRRRTGDFAVSYFNSNGKEESARICSAAELEGVVDAYVQRLLMANP